VNQKFVIAIIYGNLCLEISIKGDHSVFGSTLKCHIYMYLEVFIIYRNLTSVKSYASSVLNKNTSLYQKGITDGKFHCFLHFFFVCLSFVFCCCFYLYL